MNEFHIKLPARDEEIAKIKIGDLVYFTGEAFTARSRFHRYVLDEHHPLPFRHRQVMFHVGPIIIRGDGKWKLMAFTHTTSVRFEKWGPRAVKELHLKAIVGKTTMGKATMRAMKENVCIHATPLGVTPNLYLDKIEVQGVHLHDELGSIEAAWLLKLNDLGPFLVDIDSHGRNYFDELDVVIERNRKKAYRKLNIPEDFEYTILY